VVKFLILYLLLSDIRIICFYKNLYMKKIFLLLSISLVSFTSFAQEEETEPEKKRGFKKDHLFTGGGITLSFSNYGTTLGASPVFGYSVAKWLDAGLVFNYIHATQRDYPYDGDKIKQTVLGPGAFVRIFPVNFLFAQAQFEKNFIKVRYLPDTPGFPNESYKVEPNSFLVGAGYCNGREGVGDIFYYVSLLFDIAKDENSPYVDVAPSGAISVLPIIRAGIQIPLFQGEKLF
jgi:hypothetical protein